jgi:hypothetical protein
LPGRLSDVRETRISVRLDAAEVALLDEHRRPGQTRSSYLRSLIRATNPTNLDPADASHTEAVGLLRQAAVDGNVTAAVAYERATRLHHGGGHEPDAELEALLRDSRPHTP